MTRKANLRSVYGLWGVVVLIIVLPFVYLFFSIYTKEVEFGTSGLYQEETVIEAAEKILELHDLRAYEEILKDYSVENAYSEDNLLKMENDAETISSNWGDREDIEYIKMAEVKRKKEYYAFPQVEVTYKNVAVIFDMYFDEDLKLLGMKVYARSEAEK